MRQDKQDLRPKEFPKDLIWTAGNTEESLGKIYKYVTDECERAIKWYYQAKKYKKLPGQILNIAAIILVTLSGIIPVLSVMAISAKETNISPAWATIFLAGAALCKSLDWFGGFSSGWIRYILTAQDLGNLQSKFKMEWEKAKAQQEIKNDPEYKLKAIQMCLEFISEVNEAVTEETAKWAQEFRKALVVLEKKIKSESGKTGS